VRACYGVSDTDTALLDCINHPELSHSNEATTKITVTNEPLGVSIGTDEFVVERDLAYVKRFLVSVVDSAGVAKPDVTLSVSVDLPRYFKGFYFISSASKWAQNVTGACKNEDVNRNGVLEAGEDTDADLRLDPGKSDVSITLLNPKTRADGTAVLEIQYAKSFGSWVEAWITVAASGVSGSEGRATYRLTPVPVPSEALTSEASAPAFVESPYGVAASCSDPN
jgi:hypothetical protein